MADPSSSAPVLLRLRNNNTEIAYILFLPLTRTDLQPSSLPSTEPSNIPRSHRLSQVVETNCRPRNLDLSGMRVERTTIEIGDCPIDSPEVRHLAYHRGKALAVLENRGWFSYRENSRRQLYAEHYYSRENVEVVERHFRAHTGASSGSIGVRDCPARYEFDDGERGDEEQHTAAIVAAITGNILRQTQDEAEIESENEGETGRRTLAGRPHGENERDEQERPPSPPIVRAPWRRRLTDKPAEWVLNDKREPRTPHPTTTGSEPRIPRRATTSANRTYDTPRDLPSPRNKDSFWKSLRRPQQPRTPQIPILRRASTSAKKVLMSRKETRAAIPESIYEDPRPGPKPPAVPGPVYQPPHLGLDRRESQETLNSFAFVLRAAQDPNFS